jgi:hypothetical protein
MREDHLPPRGRGAQSVVHPDGLVSACRPGSDQVVRPRPRLSLLNHRLVVPDFRPSLSSDSLLAFNKKIIAVSLAMVRRAASRSPSLSVELTPNLFDALPESQDVMIIGTASTP